MSISPSASRLKILVFGNLLVSQDSLPLHMLPELRKRFPNVEFKECDTAENVESEGRNLVIMDAAEGIEKVELISDLDQLAVSKRFSMHDFDLPITLRLLIKLGSIDSAQVIAVPVGYAVADIDSAVDEVGAIISSLLASLPSGNE